MNDDFFIRLERQLQAAELRELNRAPALPRIVSTRRLLAVPLAAAAAVGMVVVALVALVVTVARESDVERPAAPPGKKVVATDAERGVRFSLDGRVLTVQLVRNRGPYPIEMVSGAQISATCGTNLAAPPGDAVRETTVTQVWPAGQTSLSYRFPRDVSTWCQLDNDDTNPSFVAFVSFPSLSPGARGPITDTANNWARHYASSPQTCTDYMTRTGCEKMKVPRQHAKAHPSWLTATVYAVAVSGDRAAVTFSNGAIVQLRRTATGAWLINGFGEDGLPADLRRKLRRL